MVQVYRQNKDIVPGDELWLFVGEYDDTKTLDQQTSAVPVAFATQHSLSRSLSTTSVSSKDHGNTSYTIPGEGSWTVTTESLYSVGGFEYLNNLFNESKKVYIQFGKIAQNVGSGIVDKAVDTLWTMGPDYLHGVGYITSLQSSGGHGDSATCSAEITGVGELVSVHSNQHNINLSIEPVLSNILTLDYTKAAAGTTVTLTSLDENYTFNNINEQQQSFNSKFIVLQTLGNVTGVHFNEDFTQYIFTMPDETVTISAKVKYMVNLDGAHSDKFKLDGEIPEFYWYENGDEIHVRPRETPFDLTSYMMVSSPNIDFTRTSSYFIGIMPYLPDTSYLGVQITPTQI